MLWERKRADGAGALLQNGTSQQMVRRRVCLGVANSEVHAEFVAKDSHSLDSVCFFRFLFLLLLQLVLLQSGVIRI